MTKKVTDLNVKGFILYFAAAGRYVMKMKKFIATVIKVETSPASFASSKMLEKKNDWWMLVKA